MASTFLDRLENLRRTDMFAGQVQSASAYLMSKQMEGVNQVVANVNEELNALNSQFQSPEEKIAAIDKSADVTEVVPGVEKAAETYNILLENSKAKSAAYNDVYSKALMALAGVGGQQAKDISAALSEQMGMKKEEIEAELSAPLLELEYKKAEMSVNMSAMEYDDYITNKTEREKITKASDFILHKSSAFGRIPVGRLDTWSDQDIANYNTEVGNLVNEVYEQMGGEVPKADILKAYALATDMSGRSAIYKATTRTKEKTNELGYTAAQYQTAVSNAQRMSRELEFYMEDPQFISAANEYAKGKDITPILAGGLVDTSGSLTGEVTAEQRGGYERRIKVFLDKFGPTGSYWNTLGTIMQIDPVGTQIQKMGGLPNNSLYHGIIFPNGFEGVLTSNYKYLPMLGSKSNEPDDDFNELENQINDLYNNESFESRDYIYESDPDQLDRAKTQSIYPTL